MFWFKISCENKNMLFCNQIFASFSFHPGRIVNHET